MKRNPVNSTNINSIGYDSVNQILEIEFQSGGIYQYPNVPESVYNKLMLAESKARYFHMNIKDTYSYRRI